MWEKLEPIVQHEMDIEWESVIAILFLKSYEQADIMLNRFLLRHSQNDDRLCGVFHNQYVFVISYETKNSWEGTPISGVFLLQKTEKSGNAEQRAKIFFQKKLKKFPKTP